MAASKTKKSAPVSTPKKASAPAQSVGYDPTRGKAAFASLAKDRKALTTKLLVSLSTDIEAATIAALGVAQIAKKPAVNSRLASLPASEFDLSRVERLDTAVWATWYAVQEARTSRGTASKATLPAALVQRALEIEGRMQALCEYHFSADPELGPKVALLRPGSGYRDLASDLIGYAGIYELRPAEVAADKRHYRATDLADAVSTAEEILSSLGAGGSKESRERAADLSRSWTLLVEVYNDVAPTLRWLFRNDTSLRDTVPESLFTAGRSTRHPKGKKKTPTAPSAA
jgi:hypothetical protein